MDDLVSILWVSVFETSKCVLANILIANRERRWRSEGIQVGGIQSARGVIGNWFDTEYDPHGPAGPTAFWKVTNEVEGLSGAHARLRTAELGSWEDDE